MEIDMQAESFTEPEASDILRSIYQIYLHRAVDETGYKSFAPVIQRYGFRGVAFVLNQVLLSAEMNDWVRRELSRIYRELMAEEISTEKLQQHDLPVRFFGNRGRAEVVEKIKESPEYAERRSILQTEEQAIERISMEIQAGRGSPDTYEHLAQLSAKLLRFEQAVECYSRAIEIAPRAQFFFERGMLNTTLTKYEDAMDDYRSSVRLGYEPAGEPHFRIGIVLERLGRGSEAKEEYSQAIARAPRAPAEVLYRMAILQEQLGEMDGAIDSLTRALELGASSGLGPDILLHRGRAYVRLNMYEKAASDFANFVGRTQSRKRLIQGNLPTVYYVEKSVKQGIPDPSTLNFVALENDLRLLERVSVIELNAYPESDAIPSILSLRLVQLVDGEGAAYLVEGGKRRWIPNPDTFLALGLDPAKIELLSGQDMARLPIGRPVKSILGKEPVLRSRSTGKYYLLEKGERRQIPNLETVLALGYTADEFQEVPEEELQRTNVGMWVPDLAGVVVSG